MSERNTLVRSMHDLGLATWFGGSLMGVIGLNGGASEASSSAERLRISAAGWKKWSPAQWAGIVTHGIGGLALIYANKGRLAAQPEGRTNTYVKAGIELLAVAGTLYSAVQGGKIASQQHEGGEGATDPQPGTSDKLQSAQRKERIAQWLVPALTGTLIVMAAQQGEQQRPVAGLLHWGKGR